MDELTDYQQCAILYVDDEPQALKYFSKLMGDDFRVLTADSAAAARRILSEDTERVGVLITDQRMPGETGVSLLEFARAHYPEIVRIITTAYSDLQSAIESVNSGGVFQYVSKPWRLDELRIVFKRAIQFYEMRAQRDQLLGQKLGMLQGVLILDRVRAFAAVATCLNDRVRRPMRALKSYVESARQAESDAFSMEEMLNLDVWRLAQSEGQFLVKTVENIKQALTKTHGAEQPVSVPDLFDIIRDGMDTGARAEGVKLVYSPDCNQQIVCQAETVRALVSLLLNRVINMDGDDMTIDITCSPSPANTDQVVIEVWPRDRDWSPQQVASLYSAVIPRQNWLMGLDMDLLPAYFLAHDQGGDLRLERSGGKCRLQATIGQRSDAEPDLDLSWLDSTLRQPEDVLAMPSAD